MPLSVSPFTDKIVRGERPFSVKVSLFLSPHQMDEWQITVNSKDNTSDTGANAWKRNVWHSKKEKERDLGRERDEEEERERERGEKGKRNTEREVYEGLKCLKNSSCPKMSQLKLRKRWHLKIREEMDSVKPVRAMERGRGEGEIEWDLLASSNFRIGMG